MDNGKVRILVIDGHPGKARALRANLEARGYWVFTAGNGRWGIDLAASQKPHLVLLDPNMPGMDGYEVCRRIRQFSSMPIIMLAAEAGVADKIRGLRAGGDDYMTGAFGVKELVARMQAVLRRVQFSEGRELRLIA